MGAILSPEALSTDARLVSGRTIATEPPIKLYNFNKAPQKAEKTSGTASFQDYLQKTYSKDKANSSSETQTSAEPVVEPTVPRYVDPETYDVPAEEQDFTFDDFIDIINPLHHIPVVGTIYRGLSGDTIKPSVRIVGDIVYGAMAGSVLFSALSSVTSLAIEQQTGEEPATLIADALFGADKNDAPTEETAIADASSVADEREKALPQASEPPLQLAKATLPEGDDTKLAYGGVIAPLPSKQPLINTASAPNITAQNTTQSRPMMRIGNQLIPRSMIRSTAAPLPEGLKAADTKSNAIAQAKMAAATMNPSLPGSTSQQEGKSLGDLMKETSDLKSKGGSLPPALVRDMMMMALDKYKMAGGLAPSEYKTGVMN